MGAIKETVELAGAVVDVLQDITDDVGTKSLSSYLRSTQVPFRAYIDGNLQTEEVLDDVLKTMHTICIGMVMNAFRLQQFVVEGKSVRDLLNVVSTESITTIPYENLVASFESFAALEDRDSDDYRRERDTINDEREDYKRRRDLIKDRKEDLKEKERLEKEKRDARQKLGDTRDVTVSDDHKLPMGKIIEVTLGNPNDPTKQAKLNITVKMYPYIIPMNIATQFLASSSTPSWSQRWEQVKAGEIAFGRDFIFQIDQIKKRNKAAAQSKVFADFVDQVSKKDRKHLDDVIRRNDNKSRNVANNIMIVHADTIKRLKAESGVDLLKKSDRDRFFQNTYSLALLVIDPLYSEVTMYLDGIQDVGTYRFSQFKGPRKGIDAADLVQVMAQLGKGQAPRF